MKLFIKDNRVITTATDTSEVEIPGCQVFYAPDSTPLWDHDEPVNFLDLGITQANSDRYEARVKLENSDTKMARVTEDLIDLLVAKGVITIDELPEAAQIKIADRQTWRGGIE